MASAAEHRKQLSEIFRCRSGDGCIGTDVLQDLFKKCGLSSSQLEALELIFTTLGRRADGSIQVAALLDWLFPETASNFPVGAALTSTDLDLASRIPWNAPVHPDDEVLLEGCWTNSCRGDAEMISVCNGVAHSVWGFTAKINARRAPHGTVAIYICMEPEYGGPPLLFKLRDDRAFVGIAAPYEGVVQWQPALSTSPVNPSLITLPGSSAFAAKRGGRIAGLVETGCIALVKGAYFEDCFQQGKCIQMRQDIPVQYFWKAREALNLWQIFGRIFMVIVSYGWTAQGHPDPHCFHLRRLACIFRKYKQYYRSIGLQDVAVALDFCTLWQKEGDEDRRTPEQKVQFNDGLIGFNDMYIDQDVTALKLTGLPAEQLRKYDDRGWTTGESALIDAKGCGWNKYVFDDHFDPDAEDAEGRGFVLKYMKQQGASPPLPPEKMSLRMEERRTRAEERGLMLFTCGRDNDLVPRIYRESFTRLRVCRYLNYFNRGWGMAEVRELCEVLPTCEPYGLSLRRNPGIGDDEVQLLCDTLKVVRTLKVIAINECSISERGAASLGAAIFHMPALLSLVCHSNPFCANDQAKNQLRSAWQSAGKDPFCLSVDYD